METNQLRKRATAQNSSSSLMLRMLISRQPTTSLDTSRAKSSGLGERICRKTIRIQYSSRKSLTVELMCSVCKNTEVPSQHTRRRVFFRPSIAARDSAAQTSLARIHNFATRVEGRAKGLCRAANYLAMCGSKGCHDYAREPPVVGRRRALQKSRRPSSNETQLERK